ncbi:MAG TPA: DsbA family oxidoreductase [Acidimicrobiales bacterium]|nr:DsbA family oxidoreductase [Acidimicrobiales bacterium]
MLVEIWSDVVCPWCYIGKRRFEAALEEFEHADQVEVRWRSFELDPTAPFRRSGNMADHLAAKYGMTREDAENRLQNLNELAAADGLKYDLARTQGGNTLDAHRLIHLAYEQDPATGGAMKEALLKAYFEDLQPISEPDVLAAVATSVGLDHDDVVKTLDSDRFTGDVRQDEAEAAALGCTGVPFFVIDRSFAIPGAQDVDTIKLILERAWKRAEDD